MALKVSVVTCSYNRPELLRAAIESMRAQTDPDWEHLIYDDFSNDRELEKVFRWALEDPRVRIWRGCENLDRPSVLWNFMMDRALGRYLTVLDDDNEKLPTFVERMAGVLDSEPDIDVVTSGWRVDRTEGGPQGPYYLNLSTSPEILAEHSTCDGGAMLYRREVFERAGYFSESLRTNEDWDWLRRAHHVGRVKNLHAVHSTYRTHKVCRMRRAEALGNDGDVLRVRARQLAAGFGVKLAFPPQHRLTLSQRDVCASLARASRAIPWLEEGRELCVVVSPFQWSTKEVVRAVSGFQRALSLHMEDPYALSANLERAQHMAQVVPEAWVCTNDAAAVPFYRKVVGDRVIVCPTLGADSELAIAETPGRKRDVDVLLCGYAYPSRKKFVDELLPLLDGLRVVLVGDGWEEQRHEFGLEWLPTQPLEMTYRIHARARAVVCLHRIHGDCSDGAVEPVTLNRGFMEGYSGARVFVDSTRPHHALDEGDVVFYDGPEDLAAKLREYLGAEDDGAGERFAEDCRTLYTYRTRLARVLNCVRAPRFLAEIP